jgi:hypothetical protein
MVISIDGQPGVRRGVNCPASKPAPRAYQTPWGISVWNKTIAIYHPSPGCGSARIALITLLKGFQAVPRSATWFHSLELLSGSVYRDRQIK